MRNFTISLLFSLLTACDPASSPWLAGEPVKINLNSNLPPELDKKVVVKAVEDRLNQFGMTVSSTGKKSITLNYDPECKCPNCKLAPGVTGGDVLAYVNKYDFKNIYICPMLITSLKSEDPTKLVMITLGHETCHVLGLDGHTGSGAGNLCSPGFDDKRNLNPIKYSKVDIKAICDSGGILSNVCN